MNEIFRSFRFVLVFFSLAFCVIAEPPSVGETRVVVLGIAQDGGIPQIGCSQPICRTQRHFVSSLAILNNGSVYLIDATPDLRNQYFEFSLRHTEISKPNLFDGIFLTHAHMGHYSGLLFLGKESISTKNTPVYCSQEMKTFLSNNAPWSLLVNNKNIELKPFLSGKPIDLGFEITPLAVPHRKEFTDTHGFLIQGKKKSLLYIPDIDAWEPVQEELKKWLGQSNFALLDGTFYSGDELPGRNMRLVPHPTIEHSISFFQQFKNLHTQIFFTHFNHTNPVLMENSREKKFVQDAGFHPAVDWQEFSL